MSQWSKGHASILSILQLMMYVQRQLNRVPLRSLINAKQPINGNDLNLGISAQP